MWRFGFCTFPFPFPFVACFLHILVWKILLNASPALFFILGLLDSELDK